MIYVAIFAYIPAYMRWVNPAKTEEMKKAPTFVSALK